MMEENFTQTIINDKFSWLQNDSYTKYIVIGGDLDSVLCACFWKTFVNPETEIVGVYSKYEQIYAFENNLEKLENSIWLDLDIAQMNIMSIGHHILRLRLSDRNPAQRIGINMNELRGIYMKEYPRKYPLATIHFLMHLFEQEIPQKPLATQLIFLADSTWINGQQHRFRDNMEDWLRNCIPVTSLIRTFSDIDTEPFERTMEQLFKYMEELGINPGRGQVSSRHLRLRGHQCQFDPVQFDYTKLIFNVISDITGWDPPNYPGKDIILLKSGRKIRGKISEEVNAHFSSIDDFIESKGVFSYVIPNAGKINYTTGIEL